MFVKKERLCGIIQPIVPNVLCLILHGELINQLELDRPHSILLHIASVIKWINQYQTHRIQPDRLSHIAQRHKEANHQHGRLLVPGLLRLHHDHCGSGLPILCADWLMESIWRIFARWFAVCTTKTTRVFRVQSDNLRGHLVEPPSGTHVEHVIHPLPLIRG